MSRVLRALATALAILGLSFTSASPASAADPASITFTVSGVSSPTVDFCPWTGSVYSCDGNLTAYPTNNVPFAQPMSTLVAGVKYAIRVTRSGYWTLWWHQGGISTTAATSAAGDYVVASSTSIALGTFVMVRRQTISGTVTNASGTPLPGIQVGLYADAVAASAQDAKAQAVTLDAEAGDPGHFDFTIPYGLTGAYLIGLLDPSGTYAAENQVLNVGMGDISVGSVAMAPAGSTATVNGTVGLAGGGDPSGVAVYPYLWTGSTWAPVDSAEPDSSGAYSLSVENNRTFTLRFDRAGFATKWLGGLDSMPSSPTKSNSRVASGTVTIASITLPVRTSAFGRVAGQDLDVCRQHTLSPSGSFTAEPLDLGFTVNLYGKSGSRLYVTDKGFAYLASSSDSAMATGGMPDLAGWTGAPVLAPLWFDADLSGAAADSVTYGAAEGVACVRWNDVGRYLRDDSVPNTFQLVLRSKSSTANRSAGDFDITFNYDQVLWAGAGTDAASVGYTTGDNTTGHYWVYPQSTVAAVDSGTNPLVASSVGGTPGRYSFEIHNALINTAVPSISGPAIPGGTLTADAGSWSPNASSFSYQWLLGGAEVAGATSSTWTVPPDTAAGGSVTVRVTATAVGLSSVSADSVARFVSRFDALQAPAITGNPVAGTVLKLSESWSLEPSSRSYSWYLNGTRVSTSATYKVASKSEGKQITAVIIAKKDGYSDVTASAAAVKVLRTFSKQPTPKISGTAKVGKTLSAKPGTWSPKPALRYEWFRSGVAISGAKASKYKVQLADVGKKLTVRVTAVKADYLSVSKTSRATKTVPAVPLKASTPKILGTAKVGQTLRVSRGSWTSGATLVIRWYRSGTLVTGVTDTVYLLQPTDKGKTFTVKITGSKTGYTTVTRTSKATKKIA